MYERFTDRARKVMQLANQEAQRFNHEYVGTEHILLGLVKEGSGVAANVLKNLDVDLRKIRLEVEKIVQSGPDMVTVGKLPQTPRARKVIEYAIEEARNLNHNYVGTEHLLLGLLREQESVGAQVLTILGLKLEDVREEVLNLLGHNWVKPEGSGERRSKRFESGSALDRFGLDLTALARKGKLDPCIGRENDLDQLIRIFGRRSRNRPLLLGEAGAGKSALVRGLAFRLEGLQPNYCFPHAVGIRGHRLVSVGLPSLLAGANRFQVEERIRAIADEARSEKVILFLDDFHLWVTSQPALFALTSALDAIPFCLAATVPAGFAQLVEKVSTLRRSFRSVHVSPLCSSEVFGVLQALRDRLEAHHRVCIKDPALLAAVDSASKASGQGASLIDLALEVIDEAAAQVRLRAVSRPPNLQALDGQIEKLNLEKEVAVAEQDFDRAAALRDQADKLRKHKESMTREWLEKCKEVDGVVEAEDVRELADRSFGFRTEPI